MQSIASPGKAILELVFGGRRSSTAGSTSTERPYLLLEDLVDDPIELTLSDFASLDSDDGSSSAFH